MEGSFIKDPYGRATDGFCSPAYRFRRKFSLNKAERGVLNVCALGYGYFYINGKRISADLFVAPVSDYNKTLWYNSYDVSEYLIRGENVVCAYLGNGFLNENFDSAWGLNKAEWRDIPKLCMTLDCGETKIYSDSAFKVKADGAVYYNQLRSGEYIDYNKKENWTAVEFNDGDWNEAVIDDSPPKGVFRLCECNPIRERELIKCKRILKNDKGYVFDFGKNFSGYVRLKTNERKGTEIILSHAEELDGENRLKLNGLDIFYKSVPFQCDKVICNGEAIEYSPLFTYHGFRYVQVEGLTKEPAPDTLTGVFVCQDILQTGDFKCSYPLLEKIYDAGIMSSLSNMHYVLTDCPTREKLGWTNDAAASMEQLFYDFDILPLMKKWARDICDAQRENGEMPGIVPTHGWGYGLGPVTDAILFELPYYAYLHCGDTEILRLLYPCCERYLRYLFDRLDKGEWFDLADWTGVRNKETPPPFIDLLLAYKFIIRIAFFAKILGIEFAFSEQSETIKSRIEREYLDDGDSCIYEQTAIAMLITEGFGDRKKLKKSLLSRIEKDGHHINCGMVGTQCLYEALSLCGEWETVVELISQQTPPSFAFWFENGATTLYETFVNERTDSKNHHMFSNILGWMMKWVLGICINEDRSVTLNPKPFAKIDGAKGKCVISGKTLAVKVEKTGVVMKISADVPAGLKVYWKNNLLSAGKNILNDII